MKPLNITNHKPHQKHNLAMLTEGAFNKLRTSIFTVLPPTNCRNCHTERPRFLRLYSYL